MSISTSAGSGVSRHLAVVKQYFKKPMMLVVAIFSVLTIVTSFMYSQAAAKATQQLAEALKTMLDPESAEKITTNGSTGILGFLFSGIVALCLFMIYFSSVSPKGGPGIWFTVLHALSVLELLLSAIGTLVIMLGEVMLVFSTKTIVTFFMTGGSGDTSGLSDDKISQIERLTESYRPTLIVLLIVTLVICGLTLYYINSQTAFLKSVMLTCKNPQLKSKGAVPFGNLSIFFSILSLIGVVIFYLTVGNPEMNMFSDMDIDVPIDFSPMQAIIKPYLISSVCSAVYIALRGYFAKGWEAFAKENESTVYESVGAGTRLSDASPMPTYKSTTRTSKEARQQSQPYLIGEEEDPNKKSSYIPEELQQDEPQMYGNNPYGGQPVGGNPYGDPFAQSPMGGNPYGGNPYGGQPVGGNPYGDPYAGGNPYGGQGGGNPYGGDPYGGDPYGGQGGGYNNGMM